MADPWFRRLAFTAAACVALAVLLFFAYSIALYSPVTQAREMALEVRH
jgi:hypothetical protein